MAWKEQTDEPQEDPHLAPQNHTAVPSVMGTELQTEVQLDRADKWMHVGKVAGTLQISLGHFHCDDQEKSLPHAAVSAISITQHQSTT